MKQTIARLLLGLTALSVLSGCATNRVIIHPIEKTDIFKAPKGSMLHIPAGSQMKNVEGKVIAVWDKDTDIKVEKDSRVLSNFYVAEVMNADVDEKS